jgi:transposase
MNQLNVNQQQTILTLHGQGWSKRRIARELDLDRSTVRKYLAEADSKSPTPWPSKDSPPPVTTQWR